MIKIVLLTGFLGAGKTTLMKHLLDNYKEQKIGVIINEFGKINIDSKLIKQDGLEIVELSNGSIFCACIKDKFVDGLIEMSKWNLDYLFIEASGLADPSNMKGIIDGIRKSTDDNYIIKGIICVIDGVNFLEMVEILPALERQVKHANVVIVNKVDLIDDEILKKITNRIAEINETVRIYGADHCDIDIGAMVENFIINNAQSENTTNTYESRPVTFILKADVPLNKDSLLKFIRIIAPYAYRIKGFAQTLEGTVEISAVVNDIIVTLWKKEEHTEIVVISSIGIKMMNIITKASSDILEGRININI